MIPGHILARRGLWDERVTGDRSSRILFKAETGGRGWCGMKQTNESLHTNENTGHLLKLLLRSNKHPRIKSRLRAALD